MPTRTQPDHSPTPTERRRRRRSPIIAMAAAAGLVLAGLGATAASAAAPALVSLAGSDFEIEHPTTPQSNGSIGANLVVDGLAIDPVTGDPYNEDALDWNNVAEQRKLDDPSGSNDNAFGQGSKEDTPVPTVVAGGIPPNKSDLKTFGLYLETASDGHQFLNLYWHRVQDPSGTTNMDFEFNKSKVISSNGVTPVRSAGDLLIQYDLANGGTNPELFVSRWVTTGAASQCEASNTVPCWGDRSNFTQLGLATGSINTSAISQANAGGAPPTGLGAISPRTFGEAQLDYTALASDLDECETFGSAYLKSRSSDSFTAAMKDFIAPIATGFPTCGGVKISKVTDPASTVDFTFTGDFTSTPSSSSFTLKDGETQEFADVPIGVTGHVTESQLPAGWDFDFIDCEASTDGANVTHLGTVITFNLDSAEDTVDCTYHNKARGSITVEKITDSGSGAFEFTSDTLTPSPFTLTTSAAGAGGKDSEAFGNLVPGTYDVSESDTENWHLVSASCVGDDDGSDPAAIELDPGENVVCTFHNDRDRGAIKVVKTRKHVALNHDGITDHPHQGVTFTVTGGELAAAGVSAQTDANGVACFDNLVLSDFVGDYTVTETVPTGYAITSANGQSATVEVAGSCPDGPYVTKSFSNMPLTNITVSVDSQIDGGTASTINCVAGEPDPDKVTDPNGDGSLTLLNLQPGEYVCTIVVDP